MSIDELGRGGRRRELHAVPPGTVITPVPQGDNRRPSRQRPEAAPYGLRPFQQGHLDPMCGEYAIVNGLRLLTRPGDGLGKLFWEDLFAFVLARVDRMFGLRRLTVEGTPQRLQKLLLPVVLARFEAMAGITIVAATLRDLGEGKVPSDPLGVLQQVLRPQRTAALILLGGHYDHWTVLRSVTPGVLWLFDSDGLKCLPRTEVALGYANRTHHKFVLPPRAIRVLRRL